MEQLHSILGARVDHDNSKSIMDPPGILATSSGTPWFPPLAVTAPVKGYPTSGMSALEKSQVNSKNIYSKILQIFKKFTCTLLELARQ